MRRRLSIATTLAALAAICLVAPPVAAQTGYPPGVCATTSGTLNAGSHRVGDTFVVTLAPACTFTPGAAVALTVDGQSVGTKTADANGFVGVNVTVRSAGGQVQLVINDPVTVNGQCGANSVVGTGPSATANNTITQSATFNVVCAAGAAGSQSGKVAFTGANIAIWSAAALTFVLLGSLLVVTNRRRRATT